MLTTKTHMQEAQTFTLKELEQRLSFLNISFATLGASKPQPHYAFKSFRKVEPCGIYYVSVENLNPPQLEKSIVFCSELICTGDQNITIQVENPQLVFYKLMESMFLNSNKFKGIHSTAVVSDDCIIDPSAYVGPFCVLEGCAIQANVVLYSHVTVMRGTIIEEGVSIESHSTIGATGVAWIWDPSTRCRVIQPQIGFTNIGRGTFLGSDVTVVRGSVNETTTIADGCVIAHGSKVGHGAQIGSNCHFANNISIAGNVTLGKECFLGSGAVVRPQIKLADRTVVGAGAVVVGNCEEPGLLLMGVPAKPLKPATGKMSGVPKSLDS